MYRTTREFVEVLDAAGELKRVRTSISPILELSALVNLMSRTQAPTRPSPGAQRNDPKHWNLGGWAMLFERVEGSTMPVLINSMGSYQRMEMALGCQGEVRGLEDGHTSGGFEGIAQRIEELIKPDPPGSFGEALKKLTMFLSLRKIAPRLVGSGICQEVMYLGASVDLTILPLLRCWPLDGDFASLGYPPDVNAGIPGVEPENADLRGRYITLGCVHTIHPDDVGCARPRSHNIGMYRVQMLGRRHMAMHWHMHHDGAAHWRAWKQRGERMPVAISLGGESVLPYAATCPLPPGISELLMAGFLNRRGIPLVRARTVPLRVPANAEIVIEGYVSHEAGPIGYDPRRDGPLGPGAVFEGPFGDHTGYYSMPDRYPIMEVTAITHRRDPIYPTTIVGLPPQEDYFMGKATERIMLPLLRTIIPDIRDYDLPMFGAFHNCAVLGIRKQYPLHARRVMHAVWGAGQMSWTKNVIVVDDDFDVHDTDAVMRRIAERCDPARDIERVFGPLDILDHAAPRLGVGMKIGFDATRKVRDEGVARGARNIEGTEGSRPLLDAHGAAEYLGHVRRIEGVAQASLPESMGFGWLFVQGKSDESNEARSLIGRIWKLAGAAAPPYVVVVGGNANAQDPMDALFHWCANAAAERDAFLNNGLSLAEGVSEATWQMEAQTRIAFDATPKRNIDAHNGHPVREWPPIIRMNESALKAIASTAKELGLS